MWQTLLVQILSAVLPAIIHAIPTLVSDGQTVSNIVNHGEGGAAKVAAAAAALAKVAGDAGADVSAVATAVAPYSNPAAAPAVGGG